MSIRTVLGDIRADTLGPTDYHEHLFQRTPLLPGDELVDEDVSREEAEALGAAGVTALIDATPIGLGRNPVGLARISAAAKITVVATTGFHRTAHYDSSAWILDLSATDLAARMVRDVEEGMPAADLPEVGASAEHAGSAVRCGVLKVGIDYWRIDDFAQKVIEAIGVAHARTNAPVMVHLEYGSAAFEVLDSLTAVGVRPDAVVLAHVDRNPDPGLHAELATVGAYLGYDGPARHREHPDSTVVDCVARTIGLGGLDRILVGGDVARLTRFKSAGGMPGLAYLPERFLPRLRAGVGAEAVDRILVDNPRTFLDRFGGPRTQEAP